MEEEFEHCDICKEPLLDEDVVYEGMCNFCGDGNQSSYEGENVLKNKQYYMDLYHQLIEEDKKLYVSEHGNDDNYETTLVDASLDTEGIVGYYLDWYRDEALEIWEKNCAESPDHEWSQDEEVTSILKELFNA